MSFTVTVTLSVAVAPLSSLTDNVNSYKPGLENWTSVFGFPVSLMTAAVPPDKTQVKLTIVPSGSDELLPSNIELAEPFGDITTTAGFAVAFATGG